MKRKLLMKVLAVALGVTVSMTTAVHALADGASTEYISDMVVSTGSTLAAAKKKLPTGYTCISDNVNKNNSGVVVIGVKKTKDVSKAITDIAVMNMNGGYSFQEYENVLKEYKDSADTMVDTLYCAVTEFRENYKNNKKPALLAYEMLNRFTDEDFGDTNNKLGDIFVNESTTKEQLSVIFMQASTLAVSAIESCLGIGCSSNWLDSFINAPANESYGLDIDEKAQTIFGTMQAFQKEMQSYADILNASNLGADATKEEWEAYYNSLTEEKQSIVTNYASTYDCLRATTYKNGTLLDFFMQDLKSLENKSLYPMAKAMTDGQIATLPYASLCNTIQFALANDEVFDELIKQSKETTLESASVFDGVDRSIFNSDGIALTNEAMRNATSSSDTSWYKGNLSKKTETIFYSIIGTAATIGAVSAVLFAVSSAKVGAIVTMAYQSAFANMGFVSTGIVVESWTGVWGSEAVSIGEDILTINPMEIAAARSEAIAEGASTIWAKIAGVSKIVSAVAIAVVIITVIIFLYKEYKAYNDNKPEYTVIPRIMVDQTYLSDGTRKYNYYYAVKDTTGEYADLNNWKAYEWDALYYTKDASAGSPILASAVTQSTNVAGDSSYNLALHGFGEKAAYNLNKNCTNKTGVYLFFKTTNSTLSGTAVSYGYYAVTAVAGILVGALGMFGLDKVLYKRKKREEQTEA